MKIYSNDAVTTSVVNDLDAKQSREISKLKSYVLALAVGEGIILGITLGLYFLNH